VLGGSHARRQGNDPFGSWQVSIFRTRPATPRNPFHIAARRWLRLKDLERGAGRSDADSRRARATFWRFGIENRRAQLRKDGNETGDAMRERIARIELRRGGMIVLFEGFAQFYNRDARSHDSGSAKLSASTRRR